MFQAGAIDATKTHLTSFLCTLEFGLLRVIARSGSNCQTSWGLHLADTISVRTDSHDKAYNGDLSPDYNNFIDPLRSSNRRSVFHGTYDGN